MTVRNAACATCVAVALLVSAAPSMRGLSAQEPRRAIVVDARSPAQLRDWDSRLDRMQRSGELRVRDTHQDTLIRGRIHQRSDQYYRGVRVYGGDVSRQSQNGGVTESAFGTIYQGIDIDPSPAIDEEDARATVAARGMSSSMTAVRPELVVLPLGGGLNEDANTHWPGGSGSRAADDSRQVFVDAQHRRDGARVQRSEDTGGRRPRYRRARRHPRRSA